MVHEELLHQIYEIAAKKAVLDDPDFELPDYTVNTITGLVENSETNKGVISVLTTLFVHKIVDPQQDIRYHQAKLENGFAGRVIDKAEVTPFLKSVSFPAMAESGWLTRSLEQPHPYDMDYPGAITPKAVKTMFLSIIYEVQIQGISAEKVLICFFTLLIKRRDSLQIELAKPHSLSIASIIKILERHFTYHYTCSGASRLPTLAVYAAYQCMMLQVSRYDSKILCPLESHNSADRQSGRIGDIDVNNADGSAFEGVEIKHEIPITQQLVADAYEKFKIYNTDRYYLLTTANMDNADWEAIDKEIQRISHIHGCQVIVNGVYSTLKYYLRLVEDPAEFIDRYVELMKTDKTIKFQHKVAWNDIISAGV
ncbi:MAG: hypothetical protein LUG93_08680 [Lachnospiraceae bacterium]|nr:hypothetical protein [Lachnospiraceae bacterium]